jgi:transposase InsO family protein
MMKDIVEFINSCELCQKMKDPPARRTRVPYLTRPQPSRPWEVASMDVMHLPSANKCRYILIIVDLFTRWPEAFALQTVNGSALITCMMKVMTRQGFIKKLLCDNASYNVGHEFRQFCLSKGIKLSPVSEYHPEANGVAESKVKALKDLLRALATTYTDWPKYLDTALFAYRTSYNRTVKETPFFLNHGRDAWFPNSSNSALEYDLQPSETFNVQLDEDMHAACV